MSPGFWDDNTRATAIMKEIKVNEYWLKLFKQVENSVEDFDEEIHVSLALIHGKWNSKKLLAIFGAAKLHNARMHESARS